MSKGFGGGEKLEIPDSTSITQVIQECENKKEQFSCKMKNIKLIQTHLSTFNTSQCVLFERIFPHLVRDVMNEFVAP